MEKSKVNSSSSNRQTEYQHYNHGDQDSDNSSSTKTMSDSLRSSFKNSNSNESVGTEKRIETVDDLKVQLEGLMNSLATLSAEKSKMEAHFHADRKHLKSEKDQYEKAIRDLREKCKKLQTNAHAEMENLKYKLIMERHEREKDQVHHMSLMKELQKLVSEERKTKDQLESQIKELRNQVSNKSQNKVLEAELEIMKNKLKEAEAAAKGTSPLLLSLQSEMTTMRKQHRIAIHEEHKRVAAAEQQARNLVMAHEARVAGLEAKLTELSKTVGGYDRMRQKDQHAIQKLKDQLVILQNYEREDRRDSDSSDDPNEIVQKIKQLCERLLNFDKDCYRDNLNDVLTSLGIDDLSQDGEYKQKYENLLQEFEAYKKHVPSTNNVSDELKLNNNKSNDCMNDKGQIQRLKTHCRNLEERMRVLNSELTQKEKEYKQKFENMKQHIQEEQIKFDRIMSQKENEYRGKIMNLEQQMLRQRERSLAVINEKDQEIHTLKSSFQALMPRRTNPGDEDPDLENMPVPESATDLVSNYLTMDNNPPMLHYAQELARKEVQVSGLRKENLELEAIIREKERDLVTEIEHNRETVKEMEEQIEGLKASKSREGANLEYLKNVFVNYLISTDSSSKRHMLNAISTVLRFTSSEMDKIRKCK